MPRKKEMGRAANGLGTIRKKVVKKNGQEYTYWEARCTVGYDLGTGKQIQRSVSGKTQKEVGHRFTAQILRNRKQRMKPFPLTHARFRPTLGKTI